MTPLCMAAGKGHVGLVKRLLEQGAQVNHVSNAGSTPLWLACHGNDRKSGVPTSDRAWYLSLDRRELVVLLLQYGAHPNQVSCRGQTPLNAAATAGDFAVVMRLLEAGADIDHADEQEITSLMYASYFGHDMVVKFLLDGGASPDPRRGAASALMFAAERGHDAIVKLLVARGAQTNHVDEYGATALINASGAGKLSTVKLLIKLGADLRAQNNFGRNAINYASLAGHDDVVQALREGYPESRDC
jgi:serine/threonine-protein phosphatase 6 regulatory ankyrin repeat subunit B